LSPYLIKHHAVKMYTEVEVYIYPLSLNLCTICVQLHAPDTSSRWNSTRYQLGIRLGEYQRRYEHCIETKNSLTPAGHRTSIPRSSSPKPSPTALTELQNKVALSILCAPCTDVCIVCSLSIDKSYIWSTTGSVPKQSTRGSVSICVTRDLHRSVILITNWEDASSHPYCIITAVVFTRRDKRFVSMARTRLRKLGVKNILTSFA
jgi:hypothetical protein